LLEVVRRAAERSIAHLETVLQGDQPLRALWAHNSDPRSVRFVTEFTAMGNHYPAIREVLAEYGERVRRIEAAAIARYLRDRGVQLPVSPKVLTVLISGLSRSILIERSTGMTFGHAETEAAVDAWLASLEATAR
jgi:hypothetical protein